MFRCRFKIIYLVLLVCCMPSYAATYDYYGGNIIGQTKTVTIQPGERFRSFARFHGLGLDELRKANPKVSFLRFEAGTDLLLPTQYILPEGAARGKIVVNLAGLRLYYIHPDGSKVSTYPLTIGRRGWLTPRLTSTIVEKRKDPTWIVPASIRAYSAKKGKPLPAVVKPGPKNPLGAYALRLGLRTISIHGTNRPDKIGVRLSSGCMRMYPEDIEELFHMVEVGTPVQIVDQPYKVAMNNGKVYIESQMALNELWHKRQLDNEFRTKVRNAVGYSNNIRWFKLKSAAELKNGLPMAFDPFYPD